MRIPCRRLDLRWLHSLAVGLAAVPLLVAAGAHAANCGVATQRAPTSAEMAYLVADYEKAAALYRTEIASEPNQPELTAGLVRVLLRQQKVQEAADTVARAISASPGSAVLLTARAEVEYREGQPWTAGQTLGEAFKADACLPRMHLVLSRVAALESLYASAQKEILLAHQLDPFDPDIRSDWIGTLSTRQRIAELESFLASPSGVDAEEKRRRQLYLDNLKKRLVEPHKPCRLVSTAASTDIPFVALMYDATHIRAYGLEVRLNDHQERLEIDTGAGGLLVSRSFAQRAGLKPFSEADINGIGEQFQGGGYRAFADTIQIGNMEFHDCMVEVVDNKRLHDIDGLIGMDVFSRFLVTLNYPAHKLSLGPLPARPGEATVAPSLGTESSTEENDAQRSGEKPDAGKVAAGAEPAESAAAKPDAAPKPAAAPKTDAARGPYDRFISPEMKDYTPVYRFGHALMLPVALNHSKLKLFILDTGAWSTVVSPSAAREVTKVRSDDSREIHGVNGTVNKTFAADEITFSFARVAQRIRDVPSFDTSSVSKNTGLEISGFLGARTLELTTIHIDYRDGLVKFDYDPKANVTVHPQI